MKKRPSFYRFQGHRPNARSLVSKKFSRQKRFMRLIWSAKNLGERPAQIFSRPNFWELRYHASSKRSTVDENLYRAQAKSCDPNVWACRLIINLIFTAMLYFHQPFEDSTNIRLLSLFKCEEIFPCVR